VVSCVGEQREFDLGVVSKRQKGRGVPGDRVKEMEFEGWRYQYHGVALALR
jgi:hypothetical protein